MLVVSSKKFSANPTLYMDQVDIDGGVVIRRGASRKYVLTPVKTDRGEDSVVFRAKHEMSSTQFRTWLRHYLEIPVEYRCNPFDTAVDGDWWFADKRNLATIEEGREDIRHGRYTTVKNKEEMRALLDSL